MAFTEHIMERVEIDERSPRRVDEIGALLHRGQRRRVYHAFRLRGQTRMEAHDIRLGKQALDGNLDDTVAKVLRGELNIRIANQDSCIEDLEQLHHPPPDLAISDDPDHDLGKLGASTVGPVEVAAPFAAPQRVMAFGDIARYGQYCADRELGDGAGVSSRRIDNAYPALMGGLHIDIDRPAARNRNE